MDNQPRDQQGQLDDQPDWDSVHAALLDIVTAVQERFGDREPDEDELRAFLRERMIAEGRSEQEADEVLRDL